MNILTELNIERSAIQCENRYKTILKRKVQSVKNNQQSGAKRTRVEYEEELNKIKAIDDSLEPEILQGPGKIIEKNKKNIPKDYKAKETKKKMTVSETLLQIQKEKEEKRQKRHERLEILRDFMKIFSTDNNTTDNDNE